MANGTYMKLERVPLAFETSRLIVRSFEPRDPLEAERLYAAIDESRAHLSTFMSWPDMHRSAIDTATWIRDTRARFEAMSDFGYGAFAKDGGRLVGGAGMHVRGEPVPFGVEIGYWTRASEVRRGYALEVAAELTRIALELCEADRVVIRAQVDNVHSRAIPEKLGYAFEGVARKSLRTHGQPRDAAMYARVRGDELADTMKYQR